MRISDWSSDVCSSDLSTQGAFDTLDAEQIRVCQIIRKERGLPPLQYRQSHHLHPPYRWPSLSSSEIGCGRRTGATKQSGGCSIGGNVSRSLTMVFTRRLQP